MRKVIWWMAASVGCAFLCIHFLAIELVNLPTNPMKLDYYDSLNSYVNPLFAQNWSFFAPDPIADDLSMLVRAERKNADGTMSVTPWYDVSDTLITASNGAVLSPVGSANLALSVGVVQFSNAIDKDPKATFQRGGKTYVYPNISSKIDPAHATLMARMGAAALRSRYGNVRMDRIQVAIRFYQFPRFTHRGDPDRLEQGRLAMLEWMPVPDVEAL